jgi:hypothetical protein
MDQYQEQMTDFMHSAPRGPNDPDHAESEETFCPCRCSSSRARAGNQKSPK